MANHSSQPLSQNTYNGNAFAVKTVYDDVFGGAPKFGVPTLSPRVEDYREIFGTFHASRASSIPVLDLPAVDEADVSFDVRSSKFDYSDVFGRFDSLDFALSYQELFRQSKNEDNSSEQAWAPAPSDSLSEESDLSACYEKNESLPNSVSHQLFDCKDQSISYHDTNKNSKENTSNGTTHVAKQSAVPGCAFTVNETLENVEDVLQPNNEFNCTMDLSRGIKEEKQFRKIMSYAPKSISGPQTFGTDLNHLKGYGRTSSLPNEGFLTVSDISLRTHPSGLPPPSRPPPDLGTKVGGFDRQKSKVKASRSYSFSGMIDDCSPTFFDVEVDASSSAAAASAAAMKDTMEKAQAKLNSAKELMERKKEGLQTRAKLGLKTDIQDKEGKLSRLSDGSKSNKDQRVQETYDRKDTEMKSFVGEERPKVAKETRAVSDAMEEKGDTNVVNISMEKYNVKGYQASQTGGSAAWKEATEFYIVLEADESNDFFDHAKDEKNFMQKFESSDLLEKKLARQPLDQQEEDNWKAKAAREAHELEGNDNELIENEKTLPAAQLQGNIQRILTEADKTEEQKKSVGVQENERKVENLQKLKIDQERTENEKRLKDAHVREENERRLNDTLESEEVGKNLQHTRLKEASVQEEKENRQRWFYEREENGDKLEKFLEQEGSVSKKKNAGEREVNNSLNERGFIEALQQEENINRLKEAHEGEECEKRLKTEKEHDEESESKETEKIGDPDNCNEERMGRSECNIQTGLNVDERKIKLDQATQVDEDSLTSSGSAQIDSQHEIHQIKTEAAGESVSNSVRRSAEGAVDLGKPASERYEESFKMASDPYINILVNERAQMRTNIKEIPVTMEEHNDPLMSSQAVRKWSENGKRTGTAQPDLLERQGNAMAQKVGINLMTKRKVKSFNETLTPEAREKEERINREKEMEKDRLRKIEEEREREREREKDRITVERATHDACERAFVEARERAERAAVERATAEVRQRVMAEARERLEKATAEARERSFTDKASIEARQRAAERSAVERATFEARERAERSVPDKLSASSRDGVIKQTSSDLQFQNTGSANATRYAYSSAYGGVEGESAQRCKAKLERQRRTDERAAKALAEKNMRDLLAQREQAERSRLAEGLDTEVKRWSNGKEGNLRALLSTLQYILGPDSGWQPVPLTEVITAVAVKKTYRKATLCVHPDKLQQRGANIQQKYICEKVFDLLKEAWNKFNSEER